ncbi:unnamed protein product [Larinioides sclopetarius]|uniref:Uncharacterized protein n=1 Tax=Larinioides sclopetarius TaxID=280406 RepID=A0AAV2A602_9ARAC
MAPIFLLKNVRIQHPEQIVPPVRTPSSNFLRTPRIGRFLLLHVCPPPPMIGSVRTLECLYGSPFVDANMTPNFNDPLIIRGNFANNTNKCWTIPRISRKESYGSKSGQKIHPLLRSSRIPFNSLLILFLKNRAQKSPLKTRFMLKQESTYLQDEMLFIYRRKRKKARLYRIRLRSSKITKFWNLYCSELAMC